MTPRRARGAASGRRGGSGRGRAAPRATEASRSAWASIMPSISARRSSATSSSGRRSVFARPRIALTGVRELVRDVRHQLLAQAAEVARLLERVPLLLEQLRLRHGARELRVEAAQERERVVLPGADARVLEGERRDHVLAPPDRERDRRAAADRARGTRRPRRARTPRRRRRRRAPPWRRPAWRPASDGRTSSGVVPPRTHSSISEAPSPSGASWMIARAAPSVCPSSSSVLRSTSGMSSDERTRSAMRSAAAS